jgi:hypothetical protein
MFSLGCLPGRTASRVRKSAACAIAAAATLAVAISGCGSVAAGSGNGGHGTSSPSTAGPSAAGHKTIVARNNANGGTISVHVGDSVKLILSSSYWNVSGSSTPRVLRQDGVAVVLPRPPSCPAIPGLGCRPIQVLFTALAPGTAIIKASRTTCGEALACDKRGTHFQMTVVVGS